MKDIDTDKIIEKELKEIDGDEKKKDKPSLEPLKLDKLMEKQFPGVEWVVEQLIPAESMVAISGLPSAYKTWVTLEIALRVAKGEVLFDRFATKQTGVLIVDEETGERWLQQRIQKLQKDYDVPVYILSKAGFKLTTDSVEELLALVKQHSIGLIIFDSLVRIHTANDENDSVQMSKVASLLQKLTKKGVSVLFTHHNRKPSGSRLSNPSQDMRGSSDILASVDCHLGINRKEDVITITQTKLRQAEEIKPFTLSIIEENDELRFQFTGEVNSAKTRKVDFQEAIQIFLSQENKPMYKQELFEALKAAGTEGGYSTFKTATQEMVEAGELFEERGEKNKTFVSLKQFPKTMEADLIDS